MDLYRVVPFCLNSSISLLFFLLPNCTSSVVEEPFDAIDFVERLAWRLTGGKDDFDVVDLKTKFEEEIGNLQMLSDQFQVALIAFY